MKNFARNSKTRMRFRLCALLFNMMFSLSFLAWLRLSLATGIKEHHTTESLQSLVSVGDITGSFTSKVEYKDLIYLEVVVSGSNGYEKKVKAVLNTQSTDERYYGIESTR
jgi:hypothetical protein